MRFLPLYFFRYNTKAIDSKFKFIIDNERIIKPHKKCPIIIKNDNGYIHELIYPNLLYFSDNLIIEENNKTHKFDIKNTIKMEENKYMIFDTYSSIGGMFYQNQN